MDIFLLYLWTRLDALHGMLMGLVLFTGAMGVTAALVYAIEDKELALRIARIAGITFGALLPLVIILPTQKDVALIVAGTATYRAITSERGSRLSAAFADYIEREALRVLERKKEKGK